MLDKLEKMGTRARYRDVMEKVLPKNFVNLSMMNDAEERC